MEFAGICTCVRRAQAAKKAMNHQESVKFGVKFCDMDSMPTEGDVTSAIVDEDICLCSYNENNGLFLREDDQLRRSCQNPHVNLKQEVSSLP